MMDVSLEPQNRLWRAAGDTLAEGSRSFVPEQATDEDLVRRYLDGDERLFDTLVCRYREKAFRLATSVLGPLRQNESEDVVQETFLLIHRKLAQFRFDSSFSSWLYRITYNRALDFLRRQGSCPDTQRPAEPRAKGVDPLETASVRERNRCIQASVEALAEPCRTVIRLYYWLECPIADIAEYLEMKPSTVKSHLFRGRRQLARSPLLQQGRKCRS